MSMFDKEVQLKNAPFLEDNPHGEFMLYTGDFIGTVDSKEYGPNSKAKVTAGPVNGSRVDAGEYVVFGVMAEQIGRMKGDDLPEKVKITQDGRANVLTRASD